MPSSALLSQTDIDHLSDWPEPSESVEQSSVAIPVPSSLKLIVKTVDPFESQGQLLSDRSVDLRSMKWSMSTAEVARVYSRQVVPPWIDCVIQSVQALCDLPEGWDSYGAQPVATKSIDNLVHLLWQVVHLDVPTPSIVPTVSGGIQLEWHRQGIDLEIEIPSSGSPVVSYEDLETGHEWEREINLWDNVLPSLLEPLTNRTHQPDSRE